MKKNTIKKTNGKWFVNDSQKPFAGVARLSNGKTYRYTLDGRKILLTKPRPSPQRIVKNWWAFENPQKYGFRNGLYFPYLTAGDYIGQYPPTDSFVGMFKKIIVDETINQVSVRYNNNVNRERKANAPIELQLHRGTY